MLQLLSKKRGTFESLSIKDDPKKIFLVDVNSNMNFLKLLGTEWREHYSDKIDQMWTNIPDFFPSTLSFA